MPYYVTDSEGQIIASGGSPAALMEFEAPRLGFTAADIKYTDEEIKNLDEGRFLASQVPPPPPPTLEARRAAITAAVTARLTAFAAERGWEGLDRVLNQRGEFAADAQIVQAAYDATWLAAFEIFRSVEAGEREMPVVEEFLEELPALAWPMEETEGAAEEPEGERE